MARLDFRGGAAKCQAGSAVSAVATTITLVGDVSGWPTGASGRNFVAIIDRQVPGKMEKILCSALTGPTLTIVTRGYDGTAAITHDANADIEHGLSATVLDDLSAHAYDTARDDHTQYTRVDGTRAFSDVDGIVAAPVAVGTANAEGVASTLARSDHVHDIADNAVGTAQLADDAVTANELADNAVGTAQLADGAVGTTELADDSVTNAKMADDSVDSPQLVDGSVDAAHFSLGAIGGPKDAAVTGGPVGGGSVTLGTVSIPGQPHAYKLDASAFWSAQNSDAGDAFSFHIKVDGVNKGNVQKRHTGNVNSTDIYSIPCIELVDVAAETAVTVTATAVRETGAGTLTQVEAGRLVVKVYPVALDT